MMGKSYYSICNRKGRVLRMEEYNRDKHDIACSVTINDGSGQ
jgi:hypothetical protein